MRILDRTFNKLLTGVGLFPLALVPCGACLWGTAQLAITDPAYGQSHDPIVTSDTLEYCGVLMNRITGMTRTAAAPPPTEATALSEEGEKMCVHGQTRGGILRLRRAIAILEQGED